MSSDYNQYDLGDLVRCTGTFTDADGNAQDPAAVFAQVQDPSGNTAEYEYGEDAALVKDATGVYHVDVDCDEVGWWYYRIYSTGSGQAADETKFLILESAFD